MQLEYFHLIDRIVGLDVDGKKIVVEAQVPMESTIFEGHFPGYPLMPGVLLIESMAQTSGWLIIGLTKFERMPFLAAVREAKLRTFVSPGQDLTLTARIIHEGSGFTITRAAIEAEGKAVAESELTFRQAPFPHPCFRAGMEQVAAAIGFPMMAVSAAAAPAQGK